MFDRLHIKKSGGVGARNNRPKFTREIQRRLTKDYLITK